jgi:hypothetical protein
LVEINTRYATADLVMFLELLTVRFGMKPRVRYDVMKPNATSLTAISFGKPTIGYFSLDPMFTALFFT